jgi:hypothetical protein
MAGTDQGDECKRTAAEVSKRFSISIKTGGSGRTPGRIQGKPTYCLGGARHKGGVNLIQAFVRNVGTCRPDVKGEIQVEDP